MKKLLNIVLYKLIMKVIKRKYDPKVTYIIYICIY